MNFQCLSGSSRRSCRRALLLVLRDVQEELDDGRAVVGEHALEVVDLLVAALAPLLAIQLVHPHDQHVLVMAAVEDHDLALRAAPAVDAPEEVVFELLAVGRLEARHPHALRIDRARTRAGSCRPCRWCPCPAARSAACACARRRARPAVRRCAAPAPRAWPAAPPWRSGRRSCRPGRAWRGRPCCPA